MIPLPEGTMADQAKASFKDGVLEITMPAPPEQVTRGRRLEIKEGEATRKS
jgi:HSP20 family protein